MLHLKITTDGGRSRKDEDHQRAILMKYGRGRHADVIQRKGMVISKHVERSSISGPNRPHVRSLVLLLRLTYEAPS